MRTSSLIQDRKPPRLAVSLLEEVGYSAPYDVTFIAKALLDDSRVPPRRLVYAG